MGLLPTTRFSTASEPGGSECSVKVAAVTVSDTRPLDRFRPAAPLAVDSGCRPLSSRDFTSCRTLTRAATRDVYCHIRRLPPSSRFFYFCRAQSALHGDQCLQHGDQLRHVRAPCNFLRLVIFKLTLLIITRQKTTKSTASQRVCDPTASTRPSLACDVSPAKVTLTMGEAEAASAAAVPMSAVGLRVVMYFSLLWRCCGTLSSLYGRGHCLHKDDDSYNVLYGVYGVITNDKVLRCQ